MTTCEAMEIQEGDTLMCHTCFGCVSQPSKCCRPHMGLEGNALAFPSLWQCDPPSTCRMYEPRYTVSLVDFRVVSEELSTYLARHTVLLEPSLHSH